MSRNPPILTDEDVADILLSVETTSELARRLGVSTGAIDNYRRRQSKRGIRIAQALGLLKPHPRRCWGPDGHETLAPAYKVRAQASVSRRGRRCVSRAPA